MAYTVHYVSEEKNTGIYENTTKCSFLQASIFRFFPPLKEKLIKDDFNGSATLN
jgi:hypothetical protein